MTARCMWSDALVKQASNLCTEAMLSITGRLSCTSMIHSVTVSHAAVHCRQGWSIQVLDKQFQEWRGISRSAGLYCSCVSR